MFQCLLKHPFAACHKHRAAACGHQRRRLSPRSDSGFDKNQELALGRMSSLLSKILRYILRRLGLRRDGDELQYRLCEKSRVKQCSSS